MDENEITQRLRASGEHPVPGEVRAGHLSQMHAATPASTPQPKRFNRLAVAAAAFVGFAVGSTGLAMAGALPDPAQGVAHDVLSVVQVQVPDRPDNRGQCISGVARDASLSPEEKAVRKQECKDTIMPGRPDHAGQGNGKAKGRPDGVGPPEGHPNADTTDCKGRPPWAGKDGEPYTADEKAEFNRSCGRDVDDEPEEIEEPEIEAEEIEPAPQGDAPAETPVGPPADDAPGQQDDAPAPPVEVPDPIESETGTETEVDTETETEAG